MYAAEHKALVVGRQNTPPFDAVWQRLRDQAAATPPTPVPGTWVRSVWAANAKAAQANAVLAWALDDAAAAAKAKRLLLAFTDNFEDNHETDLDIGLAVGALALRQHLGSPAGDAVDHGRRGARRRKRTSPT